MTEASEKAVAAERQRLAALLDKAAARARPVEFWWRDDDAVTATPALDRLLALATRHDLPLALAVIPAGATEALATRLSSEARVSVLQHGWSHASHAAGGEKKIELGGTQPTASILDELQRGLGRLRGLFGEKFLPVLVPPWNRIADPIREARHSLGLAGLSVSGPASANEPHQVNVHLDILEWRPTRPIARSEAYRLLAEEIERRLEGDREPVGIMTHHLVHREESWALLDALFEMLAKHPGVRWPATRDLFGL